MADPLLERFGLSSHPYLLRARNCLQRKEDHDAVLRLPGFAELQAIPDIIRSGIDAGEPRFFLLSGSSGSGRTSIANCVLEEFRRMTAPAMMTLVVPQLQVDQRQRLEKDPGIVLRRWLNGVLEEAFDQNVPLESVEKDLAAVRSPTNEQRDKPQVWASDSAMHVKKLLSQLRSQKIGASVLVDGVPHGDLVTVTAMLLRRAPTICVFTTSSGTDEGDEVKKAFDALDSTKRFHVELGDLDGEKAVFVARELWRQRSKEPWPLSEEAVRMSFKYNNSPIGKVLHVLSKMLAEQVGT